MGPSLIFFGTWKFLIFFGTIFSFHFSQKGQTSYDIIWSHMRGVLLIWCIFCIIWCTATSYDIIWCWSFFGPICPYLSPRCVLFFFTCGSVSPALASGYCAIFWSTFTVPRLPISRGCPFAGPAFFQEALSQGHTWGSPFPGPSFWSHLGKPFPRAITQLQLEGAGFFFLFLLSLVTWCHSSGTGSHLLLLLAPCHPFGCGLAFGLR